MKYFVNGAGQYVGAFDDGALELVPAGSTEVPTAPDDARQTWNGTDWNPYQPQLTQLEQLAALITQGQQDMVNDPLPDDIQKQIYDLEVFVQNYYRRGAIPIILETINSFSIPLERSDVTQGQRDQVEFLKSQMLAVFNAV